MKDAHGTTYSLDLFFLDPPVDAAHYPPAIAHIQVLNSHTPSYKGIDEVPQVLTPVCYGIAELEGQVQRLKSELDAILVKARRRFTQFKTKRSAFISDKSN